MGSKVTKQEGERLFWEAKKFEERQKHVNIVREQLQKHFPTWAPTVLLEVAEYSVDALIDSGVVCQI